MKLALYRYRIPFTQPMTFHGQVVMAREGLLVRINEGWGEIAPLPGFSKESIEQAQEEVLTALGALAKGQTPLLTLPSVQFGFDCAHRAWPSQQQALPAPYPLLPISPYDLFKHWKMWLQHPPTKAKLKVARYPMRDELAMIRFLCDRMPKLKLILDANQGWNREEAWSFCSHLDLERIEYVEDPCADFADIAFVANRTGIPVALDEVLVQGQSWEPIHQLKALVLKPTLLGALKNSEALVAQAKELHLKVVVSSSFESGLGLMKLSQLASEWAPGQAPGLDTARWLTHDLLDDNGQPDLSQLELLFSCD